MIIETSFEQLSDKWYQAKAGIPSASSFDKIVTTIGAPSKQAVKYMYRLAGETLTGMASETYNNWAMERGIELEAEAIEFFELVHDTKVERVAMCYHDERKDRSCSPDGLMFEEGLEVKCPIMSTHIEYLIAGKLPTTYFQQVQGSMYITGFNHWWFLSYYPGLPPFMTRVERNEGFITALAKELDSFVMKLALTIRRIKEAA